MSQVREGSNGYKEGEAIMMMMMMRLMPWQLGKI